LSGVAAVDGQVPAAISGRSSRIRSDRVRKPALEAITHLAFYAGWPKAMTAVTVAREVLGAAGPEAS